MKKRSMIALIFLTTLTHGATSAKTTITASAKPKKPNISYTFNETTEGKTNTIQWEEINENNQRKITLISEKESEIIIGKNNTNEWHYKNNTTQNSLSITVKNDIATIQQNHQNTTKTTTTPLNGTPFKYPPSFFMADFIASDQQKQFIWVANKTDGNLRQMIFTKLGTEKITIKNKDVMCTKIEMKPPGLAGMVWKAFYWFDSSTGEFIQYSGKKGPPGTPDFLIQNIN